MNRRKNKKVLLLAATLATAVTVAWTATAVAWHFWPAEDVPLNAWYADDLNELCHRGITTECGAGAEYRPDDYVNRAQMAAFLGRTIDSLVGEIDALQQRVAVLEGTSPTTPTTTTIAGQQPGGRCPGPPGGGHLNAGTWQAGTRTWTFRIDPTPYPPPQLTYRAPRHYKFHSTDLRVYPGADVSVASFDVPWPHETTLVDLYADADENWPPDCPGYRVTIHNAYN